MEMRSEQVEGKPKLKPWTKTKNREPQFPSDAKKRLHSWRVLLLVPTWQEHVVKVLRSWKQQEQGMPSGS